MALIAIVALVASLIAGGGRSQTRNRPDAGARSSAPAAPGALPQTLPSDRRQLASELDRAQAIIDSPSSTRQQLESAGSLQQLATFELARRPTGARQATLVLLNRETAATIRSNLDAATGLAKLVTPRRALPPWRIVQPPAPDVLLGYFKSAQSRFGVAWEYLAAIEFVETKFGRVVGPSTAGAQGPMQFLPATWAEYGRGDIHDARAAIPAAARFLVANGAPRDMPDALHHYNPSSDYVHAVKDYAARMNADHRAYYGYYQWHVIYAHVGGPLILPVGYPKVSQVPLRRLGVG